MRSRWRVPERLCVDQVANGPDDQADLTPVSEIPAALVQEHWAAVLPGGIIPLITERVEPDLLEDECDLERRFPRAQSRHL